MTLYRVWGLRFSVYGLGYFRIQDTGFRTMEDRTPDGYPPVVCDYDRTLNPSLFEGHSKENLRSVFRNSNNAAP